jgi:anti-sigma regulatory factor (Ser/Thr protein kinase)
MTPHLSLPVAESSQVGEARRFAVRLAGELGFDETASGRVALVVTELGSNLARHAQRGRLLIGRRHGVAAPTLEVLSLDHGPGMADVGRCLRDGYSTGGTPGSGFGAVQRLADEFSVFSAPGRGTVILARVRLGVEPGSAPTRPGGLAPRFAFAGICLAAPGETVCGDTWDFRLDGDKALLMVADGLGHGPAAAEASQAAMKLLDSPAGPPSRVLERAHEALRSTRGAAAAVAELDLQARSVTFSGAGNIAGRLVSGVDDRSLMSQHGTLGLQIRRLSDQIYPWPVHAFLVLHSDGIVSRWSLADLGGLLQCDPAVIAGWLIRDHTRGRDDVTVVVIGRTQG